MNSAGCTRQPANRVFIASLFIVLTGLAPGRALRGAAATPAELGDAGAWITEHFSSVRLGEAPPFSVRRAENAARVIVKGWRIAAGSERRSGTQIARTYSFTDPATGLEVTCELRRYEDFPAVEWILFLTNKGRRPTPVLREIRVLDVRFRHSGKGVILRHARGSSNAPTDSGPLQEGLEDGDARFFAPVGGCSSSVTTLPFFNLQGEFAASDGFDGQRRGDSKGFHRGGLMIAVGWTGQWRAGFVAEKGGIGVRVGLERVHLRLLPGERLRMPRIMLLFWRGPDWVRGQNLMRSFILKHHTPRPAGRLPRLPVAAMPWFQFEDGNKATEVNQEDVASQYFRMAIPVDTFWLDAGWFEGGWPDGVGNWFVKKDAFPHGLRPLAEAVHGMGMRLAVWFEPERVAPGTWLERQHREWLLGDGRQKLLNLGDAEARRWLVEHVAGIIKREGVDIYRHDFSLDPLPYWRSADMADRDGVTEIRYVEGLYEYWDELLGRLPNVLIDNGASGGRRLDLETLSRSVPLWRFDYFGGKMAAFQASGVGLSLYVPLSSVGVPPTPNNPGAEIPNLYIARSAMSAGIALTWDVRRPDFDAALARRIVNEQKRISRFYYGDIYPLTEVTPADDAWLAYQCDRPDLGEGMVMAFRRDNARSSMLDVKLRGLEAGGVYEVEDVDRGTRRMAAGRKLAEGLSLEIQSRPGSALVIYRLKGQDRGMIRPGD